MNREEKLEFIERALEDIKESIVRNIDKIPEDWNGIELRWLIKDKAEEIVWDGIDKRTLRYRGYINEVLTKNL